MSKCKIIVLFLQLLIYTNTIQLFAQQNANSKDTLSLENIKTKGEDFINKIVLAGVGQKAKIKSIVEDGCLYKIAVDINGQEYISYLSKDGKKFFQSGRDIDSEMKKYVEERTVIKANKPTVELFVMSYCPYGMQLEKGILPVLQTLGNKINFELKFCSYAMHDKQELTEQLREYCIQKQKPELLLSYLACFLEEGKSGECLTKLGIDTIELNKSIVAADKEYKITQQYNDKNTWYMNKYPLFTIYNEDNVKYNLKGSPNLIINGKKVYAKRDSESLLELICSAFNEPPEECKLKLSSAYPSAGFGYNTTESPASGTNHECNGNDK